MATAMTKILSPSPAGDMTDAQIPQIGSAMPSYARLTDAAKALALQEFAQAFALNHLRPATERLERSERSEHSERSDH
jgi:hypothetical protein